MAGEAPPLLTIIGLGNELLSDDGVGIRVLRQLKERLSDRAIRFEELAVGGLALLDGIESSRTCIIIDAIMTGDHPPGTIMRFVQKSDQEPRRLSSSHQIDLGQILSLARLMGGDIPETVTVYGVEAEDITTFREACTDEVARAIPRLVDMICHDLAPMPQYSTAWEIDTQELSR